MKIIVDTNVFISGVFFSGPPYQILKAWCDGNIQLVISQEILEEYHRVGETLAEQFSGVDLGAILELLTVNSELTLAPGLPEPVCGLQAADVGIRSFLTKPMGVLKWLVQNIPFLFGSS